MILSGQTRRSERGSILPVAAAMVIVLFLVFLLVVLWGRGAVEQWRGIGAAEVIALGALRDLHPPEYSPAGSSARPSSGSALAWARALAEANGVGSPPFAAFDAEDIVIGATSVQATVRLRGEVALTARAVGLPAGMILGGTRQLSRSRQVLAATGAMPLAIDHRAIPAGADETGAAFELPVGASGLGASVVRLAASTSSPVEQLRFLGFRLGSPPTGLAPPELSVGDRLTKLPMEGAFATELAARLVDRIVVLPILEGDVIVAFGRLILLGVNSSASTVRLAFAPSAVGRGAGIGPGVQLASDAVSPFGLVLVARLGTLES